MNVTVQAPGAIRLFVQSPGFYSLPRTRARLPAIHETQPNDSWVTVHSLKSADGGLLDPDDRLSDVADDREQIVAVYEERDGRASQHGDGTSASSDGTRSPVQNGDHKFQPFSRVDIEVTGEQEHTCSLQVRRGSEPALNQICPLPQFPPPASRGDASKRWSAAPIIDDDVQASSTPLKTASCDPLTPPGERGEPSGDERDRLTLPRLTRDSNRLSMQILGNSDSMWRWAEAADRVLSARDQRREPVGGAVSPDISSDEEPEQGEPAATQLVVLTDIQGPLGIHVVSECDAGGWDGGVLVQRVEAGGAVDRDGRIRVGDRISQINGHSLAGCSFQRAQELFTMAMSQGELRLTVSAAAARPPAPVFPAARSRSHTPVDGVAPEEKVGSRVATVTPTKKVPASLSSRTQNVMLTSNTRKLGRRLSVALVKGAAGLGFSVTTRDNPAGGHAPVYVKNILPKGAAIEDGRLRPGDRLLEIDGAAVTGLSQQQVVQMLRAVVPGQPVELVLSRHEQPDDKKADEASPRLPRPLASTAPPAEKTTWTKPPEPAQEEPAGVTDKEVLVFDIPVHDSERAGLGVSVKGKTTPGKNGPVDVGIFIKSVIHGGAASKDGRLQHNDQLIDINNSALLGLSNGQAMETLRRAMCQEGPRPGVITLTVARRRDAALSNGRESASSLISSSSGEVSAWRGPEPAAADGSEVTITHRRAPPPSISEKRHASKDAKSTDTYQRTKRAREERRAATDGGRSASHQSLTQPEPPQPPNDVGPSLGMKKSSSLESLQTMVHELAQLTADAVELSVLCGDWSRLCPGWLS
ncbi:partitioning defective 3 homolog [Pollicipes pollicipes]|uniref:partitioning defective 3 homolog n=1 Tax=Pollicipes pollicipes TaxID=41117 RepID=UPI001884FC2C|nr:partitioning defective 3 homolog [Pollicipes pollicipes]